MIEQITVTLTDGNIRKIDKGINGYELAKLISISLAKEAIAIQVNGQLKDLNYTLISDSNINIIKRKNDEALELIRHDCAHIMAEAVQNLYPGTQVTIGPAIENGFYYDFARDKPFTTDDLPIIEKKMHEIISIDKKFIREIWTRSDAKDYFLNKGETYKAEIIKDLDESTEISIYKQGEWLDLCKGPHMPSTKNIGKGFKLTKVAGAYWRGDSSKKMLTRIYGTAWRNEKELSDYLMQLEEAEKRDHRKLGKDMKLFHFQEVVD